MKTLIVSVLTGLSALTSPLCFGFELGGLRIGDTPAMRIAKDPTITGKNIRGQCLPYAKNLHAKLRSAGIHSEIIGYHYRNVAFGSRQYGQAKGHAVVAYNDGGRTYIMDNQTWMPSWVKGGSPKAMAGQFAGMDTGIDRAWAVGKRVIVGQSAIDEASRKAMRAHELSLKATRSSELGA